MPYRDPAQHRELVRRNQAKKRKDERDVGPSEENNYEIADPDRRMRAEAGSMGDWLKTYFPRAFPLDFSEDHLQLISHTEQIIEKGGREVIVMPRSSGKTTFATHAIIWAAFTGRCKYAVIVAADDMSAKKLMSNIKTIITRPGTDFALDYPEVVIPLQRLEGASIKAQYQEFNGVKTNVAWKAASVVLPTTPLTESMGSAGVVIDSGGLTSSLRGKVHAHPNGEQVRPDLILIDDPQTSKTAKSLPEVQTRMEILNADLAGMAGVGGKMSILCTATIIAQDDVATQLLDRDLSPDWVGHKSSMLKSFPTNIDAWDEYNLIRIQEIYEEVPKGSCNAYYEDNRELLDEGCHHYWPERVGNDCVSAIQTAMNEFLKDEASFMSEYQNEPVSRLITSLEPLDVGELSRRIASTGRAIVPDKTLALTAFIDVQGDALYGGVMAWTEGRGGTVIDYATWPPQQSRMFSYAKVKSRNNLGKMYPGLDADARIMKGVTDFVSDFQSRIWLDGNGDEHIIEHGCVDIGYKGDAVERGIIETGFRNWLPAQGTGSSKTPLMSWSRDKKLRRKFGEYWVLGYPRNRQWRMKRLFHDPNYWKSELYVALSVPVQHASAVRFYKHSQPSHHKQLAEHLTAEIATRQEREGRITDVWTLPGNEDNHLLDVVVGNMVLASFLQITKETSNVRPKATKKRKPRRQSKGIGF